VSNFYIVDLENFGGIQAAITFRQARSYPLLLVINVTVAFCQLHLLKK